MTTTSSNSCCHCCFSFILTCGLTALFLWLSLRTDEPKLYAKGFYVPALNNSLKSPKNRTISFVLELENSNKDKGIQYDDVNLTFGIFVDPNTTRPIGNATVPGFYQGHKKDAKKPADVVARDSINRTTVYGKVYFRVDFRTTAKYKILLWYTRRHHLWGGANVEINDSGVKANRKGIRLGNNPAKIESGAPNLHGCYCALLGIFVHWIVIGFSLGR